MEHDISKLPKWAQNLIRRMGQRVTELEDTLADHNKRTMRSSMSVRNSPMAPAKRMPKDATVIFQLAFGEVDAKVVGDKIVLTSNSMPIAVHPHAANKVSVVVEEWEKV